jgi:hypothetical protein
MIDRRVIDRKLDRAANVRRHAKPEQRNRAAKKRSPLTVCAAYTLHPASRFAARSSADF